MSVSLDIVRQVIEVQIVQDQVVQVQIWDGVTIMDDGVSAGTTRIVDFIAGSNVTITTEKVGTKIKVTINSTASGGSGGGDVTGPASSTDGEIVIYNGATGKIIKNSSNVLTTVGGNIAALTNPGAITFLRINADNTVTARTAAQFLTDLGILNYTKTTPQSVTGTVAETKLDSIEIPANTIQAGDILEFWVYITKSGTAAGFIAQINVNTSDSLVGDTTVASLSPGNTILSAGIERRMIIESQTSQRIFIAGGNANTDATNIASAHTNLTTNYAVQQFFTISVANTNAADTTTLRGWAIKVIRQ